MANNAPRIDLEFTARDAWRAVKRDDLIIVIDVLRSCSTITNLLAKGAKSILPARTLREAYELRRKHPDYLLFGERKGRKPKGFDFGNSPLEFSPEDVRQKNIIMATTSGTLAITACRPARWVLIGSFLNAGAVAHETLKLARDSRVNVSFVLSGNGRQFSLEDFIGAGAIADRFQESVFSDKVSAANMAFKQARSSLLKSVAYAQHARYLIDIGLKKDIEFCCRLNSHDLVPVYEGGAITQVRKGGPAGI